MHTTLLCMHMHIHCTCVPCPYACPYQHARTQTFHIEGWQGSAPLVGGSHPHTCMFRGTEHPRTCDRCSFCPSLHPPCPLDHLCPHPHHGLRHSCPLHLYSLPMPPSVHIGTPHTHTPCTVRVRARTVHTCSIHTIPTMCPGTCSETHQRAGTGELCQLSVVNKCLNTYTPSPPQVLGVHVLTPHIPSRDTPWMSSSGSLNHTGSSMD